MSMPYRPVAVGPVRRTAAQRITLRNLRRTPGEIRRDVIDLQDGRVEVDFLDRRLIITRLAFVSPDGGVEWITD